uniref:Uncharacterized protein n=1 Tax=Arion vulgaris TaxID=1028688 RepID=A0A0B7APN3_9EUPU
MNQHKGQEQDSPIDHYHSLDTAAILKPLSCNFVGHWCTTTTDFELSVAIGCTILGTRYI